MLLEVIALINKNTQPVKMTMVSKFRGKCIKISDFQISVPTEYIA